MSSKKFDGIVSRSGQPPTLPVLGLAVFTIGSDYLPALFDLVDVKVYFLSSMVKNQMSSMPFFQLPLAPRPFLVAR